MKAITLTQPWASFVGIKCIETRSWQTPYRGPLAIHAAKGFPKWAKDLCSAEPFGKLLADQLDILSWEGLPTSCIVATCDLIYIKKMTQADIDAFDIEGNTRVVGYQDEFYTFKTDQTEKALGVYAVDRFMWFLANIKILDKPILAKGALSLWNWESPIDKTCTECDSEILPTGFCMMGHYCVEEGTYR